MSKGFWSRLNRWLFGPPLAAYLPPNILVHPMAARSGSPKKELARPVASRSGSPEQQAEMLPGHKHDLGLLFPWFDDMELARLLSYAASLSRKYAAWTQADIPHDPWQQLLQWALPLVLAQPDKMSVKETCALLKVEIINGFRTYNTPGTVLIEPVRVLWLQHQGRRIEAVYRLLEQQPNYCQHAAIFVWWVIYGL